MSLNKTLLSLGVTAACTGWQSPVVAQDDAYILEEIIVTAQKREQSLNEVAGSLQAFVGDDLERNGIASIDDLVNQIPSASFVNAPAAGWQTLQIRGVSSGTTGEATTGYYVDELAFGVPNLQLAPPVRFFDLARIEVLRGPQGTLYGQGSMGGTVKIITADANPEGFEFKMQGGVSGGSGAGLNHYSDFAVNIPLIDDTLAVRITGGYESVVGYGESADFPGEGDLGDSESSNLRIKVNYLPVDNLSIASTLWHLESNTDFGSFVSAEQATYAALDETTAASLSPFAAVADLPYVLDPVTFAVVGENPDPLAGGTYYQDAYASYLQDRRSSVNELDSRMDMLSVLAEWDLGFATMVSGTSYMEHELPFNLSYGGGLVDTPSLYNTESWSQELRLVSNGDGAVNWVVGAFVNDAQIETDTVTTLPDFGPVYGPLFGFQGNTRTKGLIDTRSWSVFGEVSALFMDGKLEPSFGLRYYEDDREFTDLITGNLGLGKSDSVNPKLGLKWNLAEEGMLYLSAAKGFRSGSVQGQDQVDAAAAMGVSTDTLLDEDSLWSYELGTKWSLGNGTLMLDAAIYHTRWDGVQLQFGTATGVANANAGDAEITGLDLGFIYATPVKGLTLQLSGNINRSEWINVDPVMAAILPGLGKGQTLANAPRRSATLAADYRSTLESLGWADVDGFARFSLSHQRPQTEVTTGDATHELNDLSLRLGVHANQWEFTLFGENLLDQDTPIALTNYTESPQQRLYPRKVGVSVKYQY